MLAEEILKPLTKEQRNLSYEDNAIKQKANKCVHFNWCRNKNQTCGRLSRYTKCKLLDCDFCKNFKESR